MAIGLPPDRQTPDSVDDARLLTDEAIHQRVEMLADQMARQPSTATAWESATG